MWISFSSISTVTFLSRCLVWYQCIFTDNYCYRNHMLVCEQTSGFDYGASTYCSSPIPESIIPWIRGCLASLASKQRNVDIIRKTAVMRRYEAIAGRRHLLHLCTMRSKQPAHRRAALMPTVNTRKQSAAWIALPEWTPLPCSNPPKIVCKISWMPQAIPPVNRIC